MALKWSELYIGPQHIYDKYSEFAMLSFQRQPVTWVTVTLCIMLVVMLEQFCRDTLGAVPIICSCWFAVRVAGFDKPSMILESAGCCSSLYTTL